MTIIYGLLSVTLGLLKNEEQKFFFEKSRRRRLKHSTAPAFAFIARYYCYCCRVVIIMSCDHRMSGRTKS